MKQQNNIPLLRNPAAVPGAFAVLALLLVSVALAEAATVRTWTGASVTSGNWTSAANWQNGAPVAGDILNFVSEGGRKQSNTNNYAAGTVFSTINLFGTGYRLRGNRVAISNYFGVGIPTGTNTVDLDLTAAGPGVGITLRSVSASDRLTFNGDINLNSRTLTTDGPGDFVIAGVISGAGGIFKNNGGDLSLAGFGANTFSGTTTVNAGVLRLNRYTLGPDLTFLAATAIPGDLVIGNFASTLIGDIAVLDRDHQIANTSTVHVNATGSLELSDENETVGELVLRGGTVITGDGSLSVEGSISAAPPNNVSKNALIAGHLSLGARGDGSQLIDVAQGAQLNIPAQISGVTSAHLVKTNRGTLYLSASNSFSGDVEIIGGSLAIGDRWALGSTSGVTKAILGTLVINDTMGISETLIIPGPLGVLEVDSGSPSWLGPVVLDDDLTINVPTNRFLSIVGQISGPAGWTKIGDGTLQFKTPYTNNYTGTGWVRDGSLILDGVMNQPVISGPLVVGNTNDPANSTRAWPIKQNQIGDTVPVTLLQSGVLQLGPFNDTVGALAGTGHVELGTGTLTVGANNTSTTFSGGISGAGSLVKTGLATLELTGANSYTGVTTNLGGTLLVNGVLSGSPVVQVRPGSILGGTGQVQGISVFTGGQVSPGASPGNLTAAGSVLLSSGALSIELNGLTPGSGYDRLTTAGTVTLGGALNVSRGFTPASSDTFTVLDKTSAGPITGTFAGLPEGATFMVDGLPFQITYVGGTGNDVVLTRVQVPASNISSIAAITPEQMQIVGQGVPGLSYVLEAASNLNLPLIWSPIATNTADALGVYEFTDAYMDGGSPVHPQRFYRVRQP